MHMKKISPHEILTMKNFGPRKHPRGKIPNPQNIHEKKIWTQKIPQETFWTHQINMRLNLDPRNTHEEKIQNHKKKIWTHKIPRENLDPQNSHEIKCGPTKYPQEKIQTHEKKNLDPQNTTRKILDPWNSQERKYGPTKYPREKVSNPRNYHEKKIGHMKARWHHGTRPRTSDGTRTTKFSTLRSFKSNLHSFK